VRNGLRSTLHASRDTTVYAAICVPCPSILVLVRRRHRPAAAASAASAAAVAVVVVVVAAAAAAVDGAMAWAMAHWSSSL